MARKSIIPWHRFLLRRSRALVLSAFGGVVAAAATLACTLVNAYDPLASTAPTEQVTEDSGGGKDGATTSAGAAPGAIVIGGVANAESGPVNVLSVLDPTTGRELSREAPFTATAVVYDGRRDLWYVFESEGTSHFARPNDAVRIHVRTLDTRTGRWEEVGAVSAPPNVTLQATALRDRLAYVGFTALDAGGEPAADASAGAPAATTTLVAVDGTDPAHPSVYGITPLAKDPVGIVGTPSATGAGGVVNLLASGRCDAGTCVEVARALFPPNAPPLLNRPSLIGDALYAGSPAFGSFRSGGPIDLIATRRINDPNAVLRSFQPLNNVVTAGAVTFPIGGINLKPLAVAECQKTALVTETNADLQLYAVPLTGGTFASFSMGHSGQGVYFEPYTSTILAPFNQGPGYEISAFTLGGSATLPTIERRSSASWSPPSDLRPVIVATKNPEDFRCP